MNTYSEDIRVNNVTEPNDLLRNQLESHLVSLRERRANLREELVEIEEQIRQFEGALRTFRPSGGPVQGTDVGEWHGTAEDIRDCKTVREALVRLAILNGGVLRPTLAAKVLIEAGLTDSTVPSRVTPGIYTRIKGRTEWEHTGKGQFLFVGEESL